MSIFGPVPIRMVPESKWMIFLRIFRDNLIGFWVTFGDTGILVSFQPTLTIIENKKLLILIKGQALSAVPHYGKILIVPQSPTSFNDLIYSIEGLIVHDFVK